MFKTTATFCEVEVAVGCWVLSLSTNYRELSAIVSSAAPKKGCLFRHTSKNQGIGVGDRSRKMVLSRSFDAWSRFAHHCCLLVRTGIPSPASECAPRNQRGGGMQHSPACEGVGSPNLDDWKKKLSTLSILSTVPTKQYMYLPHVPSKLLTSTVTPNFDRVSQNTMKILAGPQFKRGNRSEKLFSLKYFFFAILKN